MRLWWYSFLVLDEVQKSGRVESCERFVRVSQVGRRGHTVGMGRFGCLHGRTIELRSKEYVWLSQPLTGTRGNFGHGPGGTKRKPIFPTINFFFASDLMCGCGETSARLLYTVE